MRSLITHVPSPRVATVIVIVWTFVVRVATTTSPLLRTNIEWRNALCTRRRTEPTIKSYEYLFYSADKLMEVSAMRLHSSLGSISFISSEFFVWASQANTISILLHKRASNRCGGYVYKCVQLSAIICLTISCELFFSVAYLIDESQLLFFFFRSDSGRCVEYSVRERSYAGVDFEPIAYPTHNKPFEKYRILISVCRFHFDIHRQTVCFYNRIQITLAEPFRQQRRRKHVMAAGSINRMH